MKVILFILLSLIMVTDAYSQNQPVPAIRIHKSDTISFYIPLRNIDSIVHFNIEPLLLVIQPTNLISNNYAYFTCTIASSNRGNVTQSGFCFDTIPNPTISNSISYSDNYSGSKFSAEITNLKKNTKYYVKAFATNETGICYSPQVEFLTKNLKDSTYDEVIIGSQVWTAKNLDLIRYRNGDLVRYAKSEAEWADASNKREGAWCYYNHDSLNGSKYGKLYNWFAVNDKRGLAPLGYHIASDEEWIKLIDSFGGMQVAGKYMKSKQGWNNGNNGEDSRGFNALPGGGVGQNGRFGNIGVQAAWWSSTQMDANGGTLWGIQEDATIVKGGFAMGNGYSIRCIKD
jgi:uncharacterized protein (TIGR02145 family)